MFKFSLSPTLVRSSTAVTYLTTPAKELLSLSIVACRFRVKNIFMFLHTSLVKF